VDPPPRALSEGPRLRTLSHAEAPPAPPLDASRRVVIVLDNIRSLYNTGSIFRTADASGVEHVVLCGITPRPDQGGRQRRAIAKTALGAEETVRWIYEPDARPVVARLKDDGFEIAAVETAANAMMLFDWTPRWPVCLVFGHEREGVSNSLAPAVDTVVRIPMLGQKRSLNVATAAGVVLYELVRRRLGARSR
jgi:23S rRNA (guanosine2251-2'-O)-methyltransferase